MSQTTEQLQQAVDQATTSAELIAALVELINHLRTLDPSIAITAIEKAQSRDILSPQDNVRAMNMLGVLHIDLRNYEQAITYMEEVAQKAEQYEKHSLKAQALSSIGFAYLEFGNFTKAMSYYLETLEIARQEENVGIEIAALNGIGTLYGETDNFPEAIAHLEQALALEREKQGANEAVVLNNCAVQYARMGNFERTLEYGLQSLQLSETENDPLGAIFARNRVGEAYMGMAQFEQANSYFQQNLDYLQDPNLRPRRLHTLWNMGKLRTAQQKYEPAVNYLEEALTIATEANSQQYMYEIHESLAEAHKGMGHYDMALHHYEQFHTLKETVFDEKSKNARRGLEVAYRTEQAKREATLLQHKNEELEREIQERKRAEEAALSASQAKSRFLATMSHELRTPLNSIIGFAELMELELRHFPKSALFEDIKRIHKNGMHLLELVNDVLDMARIETGKLLLYPEKVSPWLIVQEVNDFLPRFAKEGVEFSSVASPDLPEFIVDTTRIKQILLNLLSNAFKFTEKGWVKLTVEETATSIEFIIEDNGIGIPPEQISSLFEIFAQVDIPQNRTLGGIGLGLSISRDLAKLHSGTINVESEVGKGSKFTLSLPLKTGLSLVGLSETSIDNE